MASRVEQKERARAARLAAEQAEQRAAARRRNLTRLGLVAGLAVIAVVVAIVLSTGGGGSGGSSGGGDRGTQSGDVARMFAGLNQHGTQLGDPNAKYTLLEFADLQCPVCQNYTLNVFPTVLDKYVRTGRVKLDLKLRTFIGPDSVSAAKVAAGAAQQDRIWPFADLFYRNQGEENSGYVTQEFLKRIAQDTPGLNAGKALNAANSAAAQKLLQSDESLAGALGSNSTPDFYVRLGDGGPLKRVDWKALTPGEFTAALDQALGAKT